MTPLTPQVIEAYRDVANDGIGDFQQQLDTVIRERCAVPEFAGGEVTDLLQTLPRFNKPGKGTAVIDAFYAAGILERTHAVLEQIAEEDRHMARLMADAHQDHVDLSDSLDPDTPSQRDLDDYISRSSRGNQEAVNEAIKSEGMASDREINKSFQSEFAKIGEDALNFSALPPEFCYRSATRALIEGLLTQCIGNRKESKYAFPRMQPLIEGEVMRPTAIDALIKRIREYASHLQYNADGSVGTLDDGDSR